MITIYRDTPKRGETDAKWCWYRSVNGHITEGGIGHETREEARLAAVGSGPASRG
jgi:hypothetical protein